MIVQPVLHPILLLVLFVPVLVIVVLSIVRGPARAVWATRLVLALACLLLLLRPGIPGGSSQTLATETDIVLVVDTTASIVAEDWDDGRPRLDGVREDIERIVAEYPGARFALITFDAAAQLRLPLTTDTTALASALAVTTPEITAYSRGTSIGIASRLLEQTLRAAAENGESRSRMVFYFGDGEQTASSQPESFARSATLIDAGVVLGYGTAEGGPMRLTAPYTGASPDYIEYQGQPALSTIDEANLERIAEQLGIAYQHRTADAGLALPEAPATTRDYLASGEIGNVTELYWIAAVVVLVLPGVELARATMLIARTRLMAAPRRPDAGGGR